MISEIKKFVKMSKYAGERFDLIQAGGGNTSLKLNDGTMLIKASGYLLSDVELDRGYVKVETQMVNEIIINKNLISLNTKKEREKFAAELLKETIVESNVRPSIETFLHSLLYKYTLHTHPISVNVLACQEQWEKVLKSMFGDALFVKYQTPGIELALEMKNRLDIYIEKYNKLPKIIFLQNHGLIVSSDDYEEIALVTDEIVDNIEKYLNMDLKSYKLTNKISSLINSINTTDNIAYLSCDHDLKKLISTNQDLLNKSPFCPDGFVFCGVKPVIINNINDVESIKTYINEYYELPKIVVYQNDVFVIANNVKKAKEIEEVYKFHLMTLNTAGNRFVNYLSREEMDYLGNWDSEKYRQKL
ncbi:Rhamnose utilisation protein RhaD, predicted bifunctional aldolase and dehydrogenase [Paenibacillus tianmuensis]|uniref:Rhamnose utilisation protein RhaD, predicted bifunctional aldolase and dehydrogenase n=1 Tax=Paenibacillus tianmuensis TaxID=624147 RepID=A0A1G4TVY9_9BACL|nr:class II aldolase/adducin family protein [Paenibacillus tianmuensis]SCW85540.1 Rhamnose utilisation protein RhaD, predicted bifunctional aldolase and dehydrogenase [Paenibacillus tianmuensis]